ncbi:MAG: hypothetical protein WC686_05665 [Candidatus Shapirobacteria bacterium]|jgi:hypothetical protein
MKKEKIPPSTVPVTGSGCDRNGELHYIKGFDKKIPGPYDFLGSRKTRPKITPPPS